MKENRRNAYDIARERIVENAHRGEIFRMEFKDDPIVYEGIPLARPGQTPADDEVFEFRILEPHSRRGVIVATYQQISKMEPLR